jgi:hypothetical protein
MVDIFDLVMIDFALYLLDGANEMAERRLVPVAGGDGPQLRMIVVRSAAGISGEHAKPGRALSSGYSTLAGRGPDAQTEKCSDE